MPTIVHRMARRRIAAAFDWLEGFDTRIVEFGCAARLLVLAGNVVSLDDSGKSVAPFLSSAIFTFDNNAFVAWVFLGVVGLLQFVALAAGTWPKRHGLPEHYTARLWLSVFAAACCGFIVLAMAQLRSPLAVILTYSLSLGLNLFDAIVFWIKREDAKAAI